MNNLYGQSMVQKLPYKDFKWRPDLITADIVRTIQEYNNGDKGYILEVDLLYPEALHNLHNDYPLAPEHMIIDKCSKTSHSMLKTNIKPIKCDKLVGTLYNKKHYVVHIRNLQYYLAHGLVLDKVHRILEFEQKAWMQPYIEFNSKKRAESKSDFEKDFFKLMNNAVFGKNMENVANRTNIRPIVDVEQKEDRKLFDQINRITSKPLYEGHKIINENMVLFKSKRPVIKRDKPIIVGFCILELSKLVMFQFHYDYMMPKYGNERCRLCFTDTDSLCYHIQTEDFFKDIEGDKDLFDLSNLERNHFLYDNTNNKKIINSRNGYGVMKIETGSDIMTEFIGLRSKMYSYMKETHNHS
jgi:hypothetical protein